MCYLLIHYVGNQFNFNVSSGINNHNSYLSQNDLFGDFLSKSDNEALKKKVKFECVFVLITLFTYFQDLIQC